MTATDPASWPTPRRLMKTGIARSDLRCATHPDRPWDGEDELSASCLCAECREVAGQAMRAWLRLMADDLAAQTTKRTA